MKKIKENIKTNKKSARKNYSNQTGITLIALVVTIVVLLILAGVSINAVFGQDGIIQKAKDSQNKMDEAQQKDLNSINELNNWLDSKINGNAGGGTTDENQQQILHHIIQIQHLIKIRRNSSNGLVIKDAEGNEYVWIEEHTKNLQKYIQQQD